MKIFGTKKTLAKTLYETIGKAKNGAKINVCIGGERFCLTVHKTRKSKAGL